MLNLLSDIKRDLGLTYMFISHDLGVVRFMSDRVMVMYLGKIAEIGPAQDLFATPRHPYTAALLASEPSIDPDQRLSEPPLTGDPPNPIDPPSGCRFHTRCRYAATICSKVEPPLEVVSGLHAVACHMAIEGSGHPRAPQLPLAA